MKLFLHMVATTVRAGLHIMRHRKPMHTDDCTNLCLVGAVTEREVHIMRHRKPMHTDDRTNLVGAVTKREVPRKADVPQHLQCLLR